MDEYTLDKQDFSKNNLPGLILKQYDALYKMLDNQQYYGVLFKVKDVLEIALKFPEIILIAGMEEYIMRQSVEAEAVVNKKAFEVIEIVLSSALSLGHFEDIADILADCSFEDLPLAAKDKLLYQPYLDVIRNISDEYKYPNKTLIDNRVSSWRNDYIGHGALNTTEEEIKPIVEPLVKILNKVLSLSNYNAVEHIFSETGLFIKSKEDAYISARIDPFVDYFDYVFDSYEWDRKRVKVLNYNKGDKKKNSVLSARFGKLRKKVSFTPATNNALDNDVITHQDEESVAITIEGKVKMITPFFEETQKLLAEKKGILLLRAGRGMGKSTFADSIRVDDILDRRSKTGPLYDKLKQQEGPDISVWVYHFNEFWKSDRNTFKNALNLSYKFARHEKLQNAYDNLPKGFKCDSKADSILVFKKSFAAYLEELLKIVREVKRKCKLLLILDGIDEIPLGDNKIKISEFLDRDLLPEGVYILLLGRPEDEWTLPADVKELHLKEIVVKREGVYNTCLIEYANSIRDSISSKLEGKNAAAIKKIKAAQIVAKADCRMLQLDIINSISKLNPMAFVNIFNQNQQDELLNSYLNTFTTVSTAYKNQLQRVLLILSLSRFGLTMSELYFLFEGSLIAKPNFKFLGILNDLRGFIKLERTAKGNTYALVNEELYEECNQKTFEEERKSILGEFKELLRCDVSEKPLEMREILMTEILSENEQLDLETAVKAVAGMYAELDKVNSLDEITKDEYCKLLQKISNDFAQEDELFIKAQYLLSQLSSYYHLPEYELENVFLRFQAHPELIKKYYKELFRLLVAYADENQYGAGPIAHAQQRSIANIYYCLLKEKLIDDNFDIGKNIYLPMYETFKEYNVKDFYFLQDLYFFDSFAEILSGESLIRFYIYRAMMAEYFCFKPEISTTMEMVKSNIANDEVDDNQFDRDMDKARTLVMERPASARGELYSLLLQAVKKYVEFAKQKFDGTSYEDVLSLTEDLCKKIYYSDPTESNFEAAETLFEVVRNGFDYRLAQKDMAGAEKFIAKLEEFLNEEKAKLGSNRVALYRVLITSKYSLLDNRKDKKGIVKLLDESISLLNSDLFRDNLKSDKNGYFLASLCLERIAVKNNNLNGEGLCEHLAIMEDCLANIKAIPLQADAEEMHGEYNAIFCFSVKNLQNKQMLEILWDKILPPMSGLTEYLKNNADQSIKEESLLYFAQAYISKAKIFEMLREFNKSYQNYNYALELFRVSASKNFDLYSDVVNDLYLYYNKMNMTKEAEELREPYDDYCNQPDYDGYYDDPYLRNDYVDDSNYEPSLKDQILQVEGQMISDHSHNENAFDTMSDEFYPSEEIWLGVHLYSIFKELGNANITKLLSDKLQDNLVKKISTKSDIFGRYMFDGTLNGKMTWLLLCEWAAEQSAFTEAETKLNTFLAYYNKRYRHNFPYYYAMMLNARRKLYSANNMLEAARKDTERLDRVLDKLGIGMHSEETIRQDIVKALLEKEAKNLRDTMALINIEELELPQPLQD